MRKFGKELTKYFEFQLEDDETIYRIPLAGSLTNRELVAFESTNGEYRAQVGWLRNFLGDVVDDLTPAQTGEILRAWLEATREQGASVGES